jgi:hypothetical protein
MPPAGSANRRLTPQRIIDTFEAQAGHYPGYRKNHAKGLCVSGYFQPSGQAANLSIARVQPATGAGYRPFRHRRCQPVRPGYRHPGAQPGHSS